jgi:predicted  nucleic acid-binding Zn-ribbon protein
MTLEDRVAALNDINGALNSENARMMRQILKLKADLQRRDNEIERLRASRPPTNFDYHALEARNDKTQKENLARKEQVRGLRAQIDRMRLAMFRAGVSYDEGNRGNLS